MPAPARAKKRPIKPLPLEERKGNDRFQEC